MRPHTPKPFVLEFFRSTATAASVGHSRRHAACARESDKCNEIREWKRTPRKAAHIGRKIMRKANLNHRGSAGGAPGGRRRFLKASITAGGAAAMLGVADRIGAPFIGTAKGQTTTRKIDRKSTRLNSSHYCASRMPSPA